MNSIIKSTIKFLNVLDSSTLIKELDYYKKLLMEDENTLSLIEQGNNINNPNELIKIKKKLYSNNNYKEYMIRYNELSFIILKINNKYKQLLEVRSCAK